VVYNTPKN